MRSSSSHQRQQHRVPSALALLGVAMATIDVVAASISTSASSTSNNDAHDDAKLLSSEPPKRRGMPYLRPEDLRQYMGPSHSHDRDEDPPSNWMSLSEDVEFLPLMNKKNHKKKSGNDGAAASASKPRRNARMLEDAEDIETTTGAWTDYDPYSVQPFVEGLSDYDEYQQAWRLLGFTIDCNSNVMDDDYEASSGGSGDEVTEDGCARFVLWAAYVDTGYEGGGIGEYQYWNRTSESWDDTSCEYAEGGSQHSGDNNDGDGDGGSRCAKMDCHLEDTHFSVLGFFKHRNYDDWMEQLFKHEGMCVWSEEEYAFMKNARKAWPSGCSATGSYVDDAGNGGEEEDTDDGTSSSTSLYYNIKPLRNGRIAVGLYTDTQCLVEYPASTSYVEEIVGNVFTDAGSSGGSGDNYDYDFSGDSLTESMDRWDAAFDVWHTCHPCVAYDLENTGGNKYTDDDDYVAYDDAYGGRRRTRRRNNRGLGGEYSAQGDVFECYDDAGYTNVNQCMKFSAKTVMKTATFRDLSLGRNQGSLVQYPLSGYFDASKQYQSEKWGNVRTYFFLVSASCVLLLSLWNLVRVARRSGRRSVGDATNSDSLLV